MSFAKSLLAKLPALSRSQQCESCGQPFACEIGLAGCWCSEVKVTETTRERLRAKFKSCLCRSCLKKAELENQSAK
jgi:hypothetical protein